MTFRFGLYLAIILIGVIIGTIRFKNLIVPIQYLIIFLAATFLSESMSRYLAIKIHNSSPSYHFYVMFLMAIFSMIYFHLIIQKSIRIFIVVCCIIFLVFSFFNSLFIQTLLAFPSFSIVTADIIILIFCLLFYKHIIDKKMIFDRILISLNSIVLIYFTIQLFNWGFYDYLVRKNLNSKILSDIGYVTNLIFYLSVAVIIWKIPQKRT